jgi:hypothetical protein
MNTFVVLTGLMLLVPDPSSKTLTVLVLNAANAGDRYGTKVHAHQPTVKDLGLGTAAAASSFSGDWTIESDVAGDVTMSTADGFLDLDQLYKPASLSGVKGDCLGDDFATAKGCQRGGGSMVAARITLKGEWTVSPIAIDINKEPRAAVFDESHYGFVHVPKGGGLPLALRGVKDHLAGGVLLSTKASASVTLSGPTNLGTPLRIPAPQCNVWVGVNAECSVIRVQNTPVHPALAGGTLEIEHDVDLLYDLLETEPTYRYLPFMRLEHEASTAELFGTGGGSADPRPCPPGTVKAR